MSAPSPDRSAAPGAGSMKARNRSSRRGCTSLGVVFLDRHHGEPAVGVHGDEIGHRPGAAESPRCRSRTFAPATAPYRARTPSPHCVRWVPEWSSCTRPTRPRQSRRAVCPLLLPQPSNHTAAWRDAGRALAVRCHCPLFRRWGGTGRDAGRSTMRSRLIAAFGLALLWDHSGRCRRRPGPGRWSWS